MKTKLFRSCLSLFLALMLCVSVITPAITAAELDSDDEIAATGVEYTELPKHADNPEISLSDLTGMLGAGLSQYAFAPVTDEDGSYDAGSVTTVATNKSIAAGNYVALRASLLRPNWSSPSNKVYFTVKLYYTANFTVSGCEDGALYLNGEEVSGDVNLFVEETYTVTAKEVEGFTLGVTGVALGEEFTPNSDMNVTASYAALESADISLTVSEGGSAKIMDGETEITDSIPAGDTFTVEATANTDKGYALDSIVVTKDGEEIEPIEGVYGPVADGEVYAVSVNFVFAPHVVDYEIKAGESLNVTDFYNMFDKELGTYSYGYASIDTPDDIHTVGTLSTVTLEAGEYLIFRTGFSLGTPNWANAKVYALNLRTYYNGTFTVTGNEDGEVYLNGEAVEGTVKLYPDEEYIVTAKAIDEYTYTVTGAEEGVAFTPEADVDVTVAYSKIAYASVSLRVSDGGTAEIMSNGAAVEDRVNEGDTFTVVATPDANKGYELDAIVVMKDGEEVEAVDGEYGPVADGEEYAVTVTFNYNPPVVSKDVDANSGIISRSDINDLFDGAYDYYGIAPADDPDNITYVAVLLTNNYSVEAGDYVIYGTNDGNILSPKWDNAKMMLLTVRTYYNGSFTVTGNEDGEVYLNGEAVEGTVKLYTDEEYTVTAKEIDEYTYTVTGAEEGVAFAPTADVDVTVSYVKDKYAFVSVRQSFGGTVEVVSNGADVNGIVSEGDTFEVIANADTNKGYILDSITVTKDGEEVEAVDGEYGPVADGEIYLVTVEFIYNPEQVELEVNANNAVVTRAQLNSFFGGEYNYYGVAPADNPDDITYVAILLTDTYAVEDGDYIIYGTNDGNILSPNWDNAKLMLMNVTTYYDGTFTVTGNEDGEVYLNGEAVEGTVKLYPDEEYTVTVKEIDEYTYTIEGAEEGVAFAPTDDVDVTVSYTKIKYAFVSVRQTFGGEVDIVSNGSVVNGIVSEGDTFEVVATPDTNKGYELGSITVTKDGEEVEAVDGQYGPVADSETYFVTVIFNYNPDQVELDVNANNAVVTRAQLNSFFGGEYNYYGVAPADDPDDITYVAILLTDTYAVEAGDYIIYGTNDGNILSPKWDNAALKVMTVRTYYNGTFTVTGCDEGEIYLNEESVSGTAQLFTDELYIVTAKEVEDYFCSVYGVEAGVPFTPTEEIEVTATYIKDAYSTITVNAGEGGTVAIESDGEPVYDVLPAGKTFEVIATPDKNNHYIVDSIIVTKDGEEVEAEDGLYGPVGDGESYEVTVTFTQVTLTAEDSDVSLTDIKNQEFDAVKDSILANAFVLPEELEETAVYTVEYAAYSLLGYDIYEPLDFTGILSHAFGTSAYGGELMAGNTEKVRITCELPELGMKLQAYVTATVVDYRFPTTIEAEGVTITYGDDLKAALLDGITVYDEDGEAIEFTADDITVDPETPNANLLSAFRPQEVTVTYGGSDLYAASATTVDVYVKQAKSSIDTKSETITYGEIPAAEVITTPEDLDYVRVIAGIDGDAEGYVSIDIPESVKDKMQIKVGGVVVFDIYDYLVQTIGNGATIEELRESITSLYERINENEMIRTAIENSGFNMETLDSIMGFIEELPEIESSLKIRLGQVPTNSGVYLLWAISTDTNYTLSTDISYIIIKPKTSDEETTIELRFTTETEEEMTVLTYAEAQEFVFGGNLYIDDEIVESEHVQTLYTGTTFSGELVAQEEPAVLPGIYTETIFLLGGNYQATPIIRAYTVTLESVELLMDDLTVDYDGEAHTTVAYTEDEVDLTDKITYIYSGKGYYSEEAPVNAGEYTVCAIYAGDELHSPATVTAKLTINKLDAVITVTCAEEVPYGEISFFNISAADIQYTVDGTINEDVLGFIVPTLEYDPNFPGVGEYTATVALYQTNHNYNVTIEDAVLTIVPREVTVEIESKEKTYGDDDPELTYIAEGLAFRDKLNVTLTREEGEDVGEYAITAEIAGDPNYDIVLIDVPAFLTITEKEIIVTIDSCTKTVGDDDPAFTYTITDEEGNPIDAEKVGLTIDREEGETVGTYAIFVSDIANTNYVIDEEASVDGILTIEDVQPVPPTTYIRGDFDSNGVADDVDVAWILRYLSVMPVPETMNYKAADVDGDGEITTVDATWIQRYLAQMGNRYGIGEEVIDE